MTTPKDVISFKKVLKLVQAVKCAQENYPDNIKVLTVTTPKDVISLKKVLNLVQVVKYAQNI